MRSAQLPQVRLGIPLDLSRLFRVVMIIDSNLGSGEELAQPSPHIIVDESVKTSPRVPPGGFSWARRNDPLLFLLACQQTCADRASGALAPVSRCPCLAGGVENLLDMDLLQHGTRSRWRGSTEGRIKSLDWLVLGRSRDVQQTSLTLLSREGVRRQTLEAGLLTDGSSYSPTPSRWITHQWLPQLAFVPDHSGASVRELHPLPACSTSIAITERFLVKISHLSRQMSKQFCGEDSLSMAWGDWLRACSCGPTSAITGYRAGTGLDKNLVV